MNNLHKENIDEVIENLSNVSMDDQNVPNIKKGPTVSFSLNDENYIAEVLSQAGKATGKYRNTFSVQQHHPFSKLPNSYVDFDKVKSDESLLNCRLVCSIKNIDDQQIPKACLVAKGFEEQPSDILKDLPTCSNEGLCFVLDLIAYNQCKICSINIKTAFLQGEEID